MAQSWGGTFPVHTYAIGSTRAWSRNDWHGGTINCQDQRFPFQNELKISSNLDWWARRTTCVLETPSIPVKRGWHNHGVEQSPRNHTLSNRVLTLSMEPKRLPGMVVR
ncbi:hypothetical protein TNCV_382261 [Trichonephila clavipes]|nr:hypothetical protein TNCV_382261 [Trichonephila clavipes]